MKTGDNTKLGIILLMENCRRGGEDCHKGYRDAAYSIDAPDCLAAGSHVRDQFGPEEDDWLAMPSMVEREDK